MASTPADKNTDNARTGSGRSRLGKGLNALITNKIATPGTAVPVGNAVTKAVKEEVSEGADLVKYVSIDLVERNKKQPRKKFDEEKIAELAESIKQKGVLDPLIVTKKDDHYMIVAGERRWRASRKAGLKEIPVIIKELTDREIAEIALIENIQREDLDPIEEAMAYRDLKDEYSLTDDQVAEKVSKSRVAVTNSMRLLKLDERVRQMVTENKLTTGHVRPLIGVEDPDKQYELAQTAYDMKLSVREVEKLVKTFRKPPKEKPKKDLVKYQIQFDEFAGKLAEKLGTKASVTLTDKSSGKLELDFYSSDDFERLYELLMK
ncbi:MAG: ParB/RepB/Spo0J family partition protein [Lachnospiraceae bacterium]|nr:ParB/RepB/Spo0J family partition protein [Lachnospiraceae bacterium]